jgi:hypothetical protein
MIDNIYIALMHKEMDQEISDAEKTRLKNYLSKNTEAREVYQQLLLVNKSLSAVEQINAPGGLKSDILNRIDQHLYRADNKKPASILNWQPFFHRRRLQTILAIAAGIVIGMIMYPLIVDFPGDQRWSEAYEITGTIGPNHSVPEEKTQSRKISVNQLQGSIDIRQTRDIIKVSVNLSGQHQFETQLHYNPDILTFLSIQPLNATDLNLRHYKNEILISTADAYILLFARNSTDRCELPISLLFKGEPVYRTTFSFDQPDSFAD